MPFTSAVVDYEKLPLFERLPGPRKRLLGFDRSSLEGLHKYALVRIVKVPLPGCRGSISLVHVPSLVAYIERVEMIAEAKKQAEIRAGYAHHHVTPDEGQPAETLSSNE